MALLDHKIRSVKPDDALGGRGWDNYSWHTDLPPGHPMVTGQQTVEFDLHAVELARLVIVWGMNWVTTKMPDAHWLTEARLKGTKVVVIACEYSSTSTKGRRGHRRASRNHAGAGAGSLQRHHARRNSTMRDYVRRFTDLPLLVRADNLKLLRAEEVFGSATDGSEKPDEDPGKRKRDAAARRSNRHADSRGIEAGVGRLCLVESEDIQARSDHARSGGKILAGRRSASGRLGGSDVKGREEDCAAARFSI